jgi:uroporphyrinogen-III synthase
VGQVQAVLLTSGNAVPGLPGRLRGETILTVGDATAARARAAGFADVRSAGADAVALAELARAQCHPEEGALLLACGAGQGETLAELLRADGFRVLRRVTYATLPATQLPAPALAALAAGEVAAALVFSRESGRRLVNLLRGAGVDVRDVEALAISQAAASGLAPLPWRRIRVASHPDQDALLGLLP